MDQNKGFLDELYALAKESGVTLQPFEANELVFEENIHLNCFYCARYGYNWRCPPKIPNLNYEKIFNEFNNHFFVYNYYEMTSKNKDSIRTESTNHLHKSILTMEKLLFENGISTTISFIGGSCKLCKNGCNEIRCNNPYASRIPLEATGVNIEKTASKYGIETTWPVKNSMLRLGAVLW